MAPSPDSLAVEATSRPRKCGHETPQLRLERRLHDGSPYRSNDLVSAGPGEDPHHLAATAHTSPPRPPARGYLCGWPTRPGGVGAAPSRAWGHAYPSAAGPA